MPVGSKEVVDYVNTTSGLAREVIANDQVSGAGVIVQYSTGPGTFSYIVTEGLDNITTEAGDLLITQS
jgi:hypothetical protein